MPGVETIVLSRNADIDGLQADYRWATRALTFSFPTTAADYPASDYGAGEEPSYGFLALNAAQQTAVTGILAQIAAVSGLTFTRLSGGAGDLRFGRTGATETAHAYLPVEAGWGGDSWYATSDDYSNPVKGSYGYATFVHEIGHALGLKHPHEDARVMTAAHDSMETTVMSYRSYTGASAERGYTNEEFGFAQSLMMYDIAALQTMYGANYGTNAGDSVYRWNPATGEMSINGAGQGAPGANRILLTVWDGGGNDTYETSLLPAPPPSTAPATPWPTASPAMTATMS